MRYLLTGATGNIGSLVTQRLLTTGARPCVLVRDAAKARALFGDRVEVRVGDLAGPRASLAKAFADADAIFLLNSGYGLEKRDRVCALAARDAGAQHLVKLSTLDVHTGIGTGPWHARGEEAVRESGVGFTFIQSAAFMSNVLSWASSIRAEGVLRSSTGEGKIAFIHPDDLADVAVRALVSGDHRGASLVITGPRALSYGEMASAIGGALGNPIRFEVLSDAEALAGALRWADRRYAEALVDIWRAVREGRLATVTDGVQRVLGRAPMSFEQWAAQNRAGFA
jgi:uncharacterized protein YbjT (DUF2867 family)